jgi:hypothetical protein
MSITDQRVKALGGDTRYDRLALLGNPGSGKTTIGDAWLLLREQLDAHDGRRISFAGALRQEVAHHMSRVISEDWQNTKGLHGGRQRAEDFLMGEFQHPATKDMWRPLLQWWGTDFRRNADEDYWADRVREKIESFEAVGDRGLSRSIVIDDCRFPNEYDLLRDKGFTFVRLADGDTTRTLTAEQQAHESEAYWPDWPVDIELGYEKGPDRQADRIAALIAARS